MRAWRTWRSMLVMLVMATGCLAGTDQDPPMVLPDAGIVPDASPVSFDGKWTGMTSQNFGLSFTVLNRGITEMGLSYIVPNCGVIGSTTITFTTPVAIDPQGALRVTVSGPPLGFVMIGTLAASSMATGTLALSWSQG